MKIQRTLSLIQCQVKTKTKIMTEKPKNRYVVYQYNDNASSSYRGCRFITSWV